MREIKIVLGSADEFGQQWHETAVFKDSEFVYSYRTLGSLALCLDSIINDTAIRVRHLMGGDKHQPFTVFDCHRLDSCSRQLVRCRSFGDGQLERLIKLIK